MKYQTTISLALILTLFGCAPGNTRLEEAYGDAVRNMVYHQIADPQAAANPDAEPVAGLDGDKAERVLRQHDENVAKPEPVTNEIHLNIGN